MQWDIQGAEGLDPQNRAEVAHMVAQLVKLEDALVSIEHQDGAFLQMVLRAGDAVAINVGEGRHKSMRQVRVQGWSQTLIVELLDAYRREDPVWQDLISAAIAGRTPKAPEPKRTFPWKWGIALLVLGAVGVLVALLGG